MRLLPARASALALLGLAVVALAGCGGSGHPATTTSPATTAAAATTGTSTTSASGTEVVTLTLGVLASTAHCGRLTNLATAFESALSVAGGNVARTSRVLDEFAARTPDAIRPDFETIAQAFSQIADHLKGVELTSGGTINPAALAKLEQYGAQIDSPRLTQAADAIKTWADENCKKS